MKGISNNFRITLIQENMCFLVFEGMVVGILDDKLDFDYAFSSASEVDLTHAFAEGICKKAFSKFNELWKTFEKKDTRVSYDLFR